MPNIEFLAVTSESVTDDDVKLIAENAPYLDGLDLSGTSITDKSLEYVSRMPDLRSLRCVLTRITDACIPSVAKMRSIEVFSVDMTEISAPGRAELKRVKPVLRLSE